MGWGYYRSQMLACFSDSYTSFNVSLASLSYWNIQSVDSNSGDGRSSCNRMVAGSSPGSKGLSCWVLGQETYLIVTLSVRPRAADATK